jgi:hypothetical protein
VFGIHSHEFTVTVIILLLLGHYQHCQRVCFAAGRRLTLAEREEPLPANCMFYTIYALYISPLGTTSRRHVETGSSPKIIPFFPTTKHDTQPPQDSDTGNFSLRTYAYACLVCTYCPSSCPRRAWITQSREREEAIALARACSCSAFVGFVVNNQKQGFYAAYDTQHKYTATYAARFRSITTNHSHQPRREQYNSSRKTNSAQTTAQASPTIHGLIPALSRTDDPAGAATTKTTATATSMIGSTGTIRLRRDASATSIPASYSPTPSTAPVSLVSAETKAQAPVSTAPPQPTGAGIAAGISVPLIAIVAGLVLYFFFRKRKQSGNAVKQPTGQVWGPTESGTANGIEGGAISGIATASQITSFATPAAVSGTEYNDYGPTFKGQAMSVVHAVPGGGDGQFFHHHRRHHHHHRVQGDKARIAARQLDMQGDDVPIAEAVLVVD